MLKLLLCSKKKGKRGKRFIVRWYIPMFCLECQWKEIVTLGMSPLPFCCQTCAKKFYSDSQKNFLHFSRNKAKSWREKSKILTNFMADTTPSRPTRTAQPLNFIAKVHQYLHETPVASRKYTNNAYQIMHHFQVRSRKLKVPIICFPTENKIQNEPFLI